MLPSHNRLLCSSIVSDNGFCGIKHFNVRPGEPVELDPSRATESPGVAKQRPQELDVAAGKSERYAPRRLLSDGSDDGSLPSTPEDRECEGDDGDGHENAAASNGELRERTRVIVGDFFGSFSGVRTVRSNKYQDCLTAVAKNLSEKHEYAFRGMLNRLDLKQKGNDMSFIGDIAENIFSDGKTNWGRIASLLTFGAAVCRKLKELGKEDCVELVVSETCSYLVSKQRSWLLSNNAWDGFVEFFKEPDHESTVRKTLFAFLGIASVGVLLTQLSR